ncbi:MAG: endolytic transglycosylase MltG [Candidatus Staskawiczbacteria bacterium]|nr:endolytic transglycosylase MltG [Candidatus Staskawiczbacteria bacterium]
MNRYLKIFLFIVPTIIILVIFLDVFSKNPQTEGFFTISRGDNVLQIAGNLQNKGYITSRIMFVWQAVASGNLKKMKAGRYYIEKGLTDKNLIEKFVKFQSLPISVLIAPGKTTNNIAQILSQNYIVGKSEFLNLVLNNDKKSYAEFYSSLLQKYAFLSDKPKDVGLEGYLFPDSYLIDSSASSQDIVKQMMDNFDKKLTQEMREEIKKQKRTIFEVITMASILEKEVKTQKDKQVVAGVLWKRADNGLPLEVDSTLLYFLASQHPSAIDKNVDSPYNTYKHAGLPVGPICNPGINSILAAIYPENSDYWFYLSAPGGETIFSKNLGQHLINKAKYLTN